MIYIAAHKKFNVPQLDNYAVLQVGAQGKENLGYLQEIIFHIRILISVSLQVYTGYGRTAMMNTKDLFITEDILGKAI